MKLKKENENYCGTVVHINNIIPIENCDNVVHTNIFGNLVIVGKDTKINESGIFFPPETKLSEDFLSKNNLYRHNTLNSDQSKTGYFEDNCRIRTVKFRGNPSMGIFVPLDFLNYICDSTKLKVGDEFTHIDGIEICSKYIVQSRIKESSGGTKFKKKHKDLLIENQFRLHISTSQLGKNIHRIKPNDILSITEKFHGCVDADTKVETLEFGTKTIKHIVDNKLQCHIKAFDTEIKEVVYVPIDDYYIKKDNGDWYEIELEDGTTIKITGNNPVWLPQLESYRNAEKLKVGDSLLIDK